MPVLHGCIVCAGVHFDHHGFSRHRHALLAEFQWQPPIQLYRSVQCPTQHRRFAARIPTAPSVLRCHCSQSWEFLCAGKRTFFTFS